MINVALSSNGTIASNNSGLTKSDGMPMNGINGSLATGSGNNWLGTSANNGFVLTFKKRVRIYSGKLMSTENWGWHFTQFKIYITNDVTIKDTDPISSYTYLGTYNITAGEALYDIQGLPSFSCVKLLLQPTNSTGSTPSITEIQLFGSFAQYLLSTTDGFYDLSDSKYDLVNKRYDKLTNTNNESFFANNDLDLDSITRPKTINGETFVPINKFPIFKIHKFK